MPSALPPWETETAAALLQSAILAALAGLCLLLYFRHRKTYLAWWAAGWAIYALRLGAIIVFLLTDDRVWLYWHQVVTGWSALALLWAALVFARQAPWRPAYLAFVLFPPLWSYVAIYRLEDFLLAAVPSVLFLSAVTAGTGWLFRAHRRRVGGTGAGVLAWTLLLWGLHHLDYPFLRAQGAWNPWGYYLDILFALGTGTGLLLLVMDDQRRGLAALSALAADLQQNDDAEADVLDRLLGRPLELPAVRGTALYYVAEHDLQFVRGSGACAAWTDTTLSGPAADAVRRAAEQRRPQTAHPWSDPRGDGPPFAFGAVLPVLGADAAMGGLVIVGDARDPFTALDEDFLTALGRQVGAALERSAPSSRHPARNAELASLSARMVRQNEEERRRLSRELHDETAQVLSAVKMQLGLLHQQAPTALRQDLARVAELVDEGIESIRRVTQDLRPTLLDDLGLVPALRALALEFRDRCGLSVQFSASGGALRLEEAAELALYRSLQEALSNVGQHAAARTVTITLGDGPAPGHLTLRVVDDGRGFDVGRLERLEREGHLGLAGMRERLEALGGGLAIESRPGAGVTLEIRMPGDAA